MRTAGTAVAESRGMDLRLLLFTLALVSVSNSLSTGEGAEESNRSTPIPWHLDFEPLDCRPSNRHPVTLTTWPLHFPHFQVNPWPETLLLKLGRTCTETSRESFCHSHNHTIIPNSPIGLNWTILNTSLTGTSMNIKVTWEPPRSAYTKTGLIPLKYQLQYKEVGETKWTELEPKLSATEMPLYSLKPCHDYEVRVRAAKNASETYGKFSEVLYVSFGAAGLVPYEEEGGPQIIKCRSPEMETFSCYWSNGDFPHLSAPGTIQLLYFKWYGNISPMFAVSQHQKLPPRKSEWKECPDYVTAGENSCYFNVSYTSVWVPYCIKLVSGNQMYDKKVVRVEDIVIPDPPIGLNWTVLNTSPTGIYKDIQVTWKAPPTADVKNGWITLRYQLQYKEVNETEWSEPEPDLSATKLPLYSLKTCHDYEIRVRAAQSMSEIYGEFSEVLYVSFGAAGLISCEEEFQVPWPLMMAFGILGLMVMLSLIFFSKQQKLKILILPPVPVPKIKGIDPDLFKKGKLDEVNSILASHGSYMPQLYGDDSWVEFIELDIDEAEERPEGSDTDRLLGDDHLKSHSCLGVRDDDSGRASCCEPDIPETDFSASDTCDGTSDIDHSKKVNDKEDDLLCLEQKNNEKPQSYLENTTTQLSSDNPEDQQPKAPVSNSTESTSPSVQTQLSNQSSVATIDFYTQVSDITPGGSVVLSPGQKIKMGRAQSKAQKQLAAQCQTDFAMDNAYFCELDVKKCVTLTPREEPEPDVQEQSFSEGAYVATESLTTIPVNSATATAEAEEEPGSSEMPVPDYTSIHIVQSPQGLLLNATALPVPDKEFIVSCGYLSTDQLNKILP